MRDCSFIVSLRQARTQARKLVSLCVISDDKSARVSRVYLSARAHAMKCFVLARATHDNATIRMLISGSEVLAARHLEAIGTAAAAAMQANVTTLCCSLSETCSSSRLEAIVFIRVRACACVDNSAHITNKQPKDTRASALKRMLDLLSSCFRCSIRN